MGNTHMYQSGDDNCMQCCLAYLLDVGLEKVTNIALLPEDLQSRWFNFLNGYLRGVFQKELQQVKEQEGLGINLVVSMDRKTTHAVVVDKDKVVWDPNPEHPVYEETVVRLVLVDYEKKDEVGQE